MHWTFDNGYYLFNTFGMSGQWSFEEKKHMCIGFYFGEYPSNSSENLSFESIYFNDPRHFGTVKLIKDEQALLNKLNSLGWDPLQDKLENYQEHINNSLQKSSKPIVKLLMDQSIFAGVGNYIKCEAR